VPIALKYNVSIIGWSLFYFPFFSSCLGGGGVFRAKGLKKERKRNCLHDTGLRNPYQVINSGKQAASSHMKIIRL